MAALPFLDTNIIVSLLTGDNPQQQHQAEQILKQVEAGSLTVTAPDTVIADCVYVLSAKRLYNLPAATIAELLLPIVRLPHFRLKNRNVVIAALKLFAEGMKFDDALILSAMRQSGTTILFSFFSFDQGFDRIEGISRLEEPIHQAEEREGEAA